VDGVGGIDGTDGSDGTDGVDAYNGLTILDGVVGVACDAYDGTGQRIRSGLDTDRSGTLDISEIEYTAFVCNGANGADGTDGADGLSSLMNISSEPIGGNCQYGGQKIEYGLDFNENDVLDSFEVIDAVFACNGADGVDGTDGTDGVSTALIISDEPVGINCQHGGKKIVVGPDADQDGIPDSIISTVYSCNERVVYTPQGASSSVCNSFTAIASNNADHCVFYDAVGGWQNFQGAASTIFVSTGWCSSECFDASGNLVTISVCTGVGFYNTDVNICTHVG
ncbi:MAG: hypothetical protein Q7J14_00945, partial [Candidatus Magasanikbacteria bacterium]|nr:hypothetical protein [Candidatus Magasanikbacteria bacterium]